ncbi:helix-turn-helix transcriptional regulator [Mobilitalea sibirica]|uniref:Helix-turn-helix transcriptional regulator n=1 Tax=Mobilitalea sibirica TaxID=1462919 RepID=A0A8J7H455_9FIRM|nr:AraC family transcriptional regulator [Mobilitalea sibirica]MBH1941970.1 helix-turn-helix transcriptional regulator [Mobilitalea sibirica]
MNSYIFETIDHGIKFPAKIFVTSIEQSSYHWHYDYELILVLKGSLSLKLWPDSCVMKEGDIVLVNSKVVHGLSETNENNICLIMQLKQELFEDRKDKNQNYQFYLNSVTDIVKPMVPYETFTRTAAEIGLQYYENSLTNYFRIQALLYTLVADIFQYTQYDIRQYADKNTTVEEADTLLRIIEYVEQNYYEDSITDSLCRYIGMSEKTLYRFLKSHTNLTLKELVISIKLEKTLHMLSKTDKPISVIAQECGFGTDKTFYRIFKNAFGMTPTEYRISGTIVEENKQVQGYIDYSKRDAIRLLKKYI